MASERSGIEHIGSPTHGGKRLPFSDAVRVGDMLFLSGVIGVAPDGTLPEGIEAQAREAMNHVGRVLEQQGLGFQHVVKCTVMLNDMADWPAFNAVYARYFDKQKFPARSAFGANGLALEALVELECVAYAGDG